MPSEGIDDMFNDFLLIVGENHLLDNSRTFGDMGFMAERRPGRIESRLRCWPPIRLTEYAVQMLTGYFALYY
jgi:hypothetical protein